MLVAGRNQEFTYIQTKYDDESMNMVNISNGKPMLTATWMDFGNTEGKILAG